MDGLNKKYHLKLRLAFVIFIIFTSGFACGFALSKYFSKSAGSVPPGPPPPLAIQDLNLTEAQLGKAKLIGDKYLPEIVNLKKKIKPELDSIHEKMRNELRNILTDAQKRIFDQDTSSHPRHGHGPPMHFPPHHHRGMHPPPPHH
ncbi:hypothetical protein KKF34_00655 [Myxococcota bacterium]|nr:hypothetical protein [Myxococcota bacterium]MBU1381290.1 hypothetical protein [Myxococcota bacterium]MBU1495371.1 hypothetical protein [Myxococcota bacterium]